MKNFFFNYLVVSPWLYIQPAPATNKLHLESNTTLVPECNMAVWDNVRSDLRLQNLSALSLCD
jgi:hypothetical protein